MSMIQCHLAIGYFIYRNENEPTSKEMNIHIEIFYSLYGVVKDVQKKMVEGNLSNSEVAVEVERVNIEETDVSDEYKSDKERFTVILRDAWYFCGNVVT